MIDLQSLLIPLCYILCATGLGMSQQDMILIRRLFNWSVVLPGARIIHKVKEEATNCCGILKHLGNELPLLSTKSNEGDIPCFDPDP